MRSSAATSVFLRDRTDRLAWRPDDRVRRYVVHAYTDLYGLSVLPHDSTCPN